MSQPWDYIAKLVCIGDSGTGKSSNRLPNSLQVLISRGSLQQLTIRLCEGRFSQTADVTIGVEFGSRIVPVGPPASLALNINDPSSALFPNTSAPRTFANGPATNGQSSEPQVPTTAPESKSRPSQPVPTSKKQRLAPSSRDAGTTPRQKHMKLSLWDTAGQETYKSITRSYFRGASGALLVYDITRRDTFEAVTAWLHDLRQIAEEGIIVVLVGNKRDLSGSEEDEAAEKADKSSTQQNQDEEESAQNGDAKSPRGTATTGLNKRKSKRAVTRAEAEDWCARNNVPYCIETSAKSGEGVERAFLEVSERIYQNIEAGKYDLNDRRSGVKGPGAGGAGGGRGAGGASGGGGTVKLGDYVFLQKSLRNSPTSSPSSPTFITVLAVDLCIDNFVLDIPYIFNQPDFKLSPKLSAIMESVDLTNEEKLDLLIDLESQRHTSEDASEPHDHSRESTFLAKARGWFSSYAYKAMPTKDTSNPSTTAAIAMPAGPVWDELFLPAMYGNFDLPLNAVFGLTGAVLIVSSVHHAIVSFMKTEALRETGNDDLERKAGEIGDPFGCGLNACGGIFISWDTSE
ncbi:hypothetical protein MMC25_006154 [Agyrium rufum]|nr:hypothetical protein [Agyrium rufum]